MSITNHINANEINEKALLNFKFRDVQTGKVVMPNKLIISEKDILLDKNLLKKTNLFSIKLYKGTYHIRIEANGYKPMDAKIIVDSIIIINQTFNLDPIVSDFRFTTKYIKSKQKEKFTFISGYIVNENGLPVTSAKISINDTISNSTQDGYFEIYAKVKGLEDEKSELIVTRNGFEPFVYQNIDIFSKGDWFVNVLLKKKTLQNTTIERLGVLNDLNSDKIILDPNNFIQTHDNRINNLVCLPSSVNVGLSSSGTSCCPGGAAGYPSCTTVQTFSLDAYVKKVLPNEWVASWNTSDAFKAGAIAIRSYTINRINHPVYSGYDICSSPCCQKFGNSNSTTDLAVDATTGYVLQSSNGDVALTEYSAENNHLLPVCADNNTGSGCSDGQFYWNGNCYSDLPSAGKRLYGHGRGMSQRGSARWSSGNIINSCSNTIQSNAHGFGTKNWQQILQLYYPNLTLVNCGTTSQTPPNDNCADAITLTSNTSCSNTSGTLNGATVDGFPTQPNCDVFGSGASQKGIFYKFTAVTNSHTITVTPTGSGSTAVDAVVTVYTGTSCNSLNQFDCFGGTGGAGGTQKSKTVTGLTIGNTYWIRIYDYGSVDPALPDFQICVTHQNVVTCSAPSNVNISNTTQTSVLVSWTAPIGTTSTYLRYRALSSGSFTQVDVTGLTSYTIPNLTCGTNYEEYLISNCNSGGTQSTSTQSFPTSACTPSCTYSLSSNSANFPYTGGNGSFTINATAGNGCNWSVNTGSTSGCSLTNITSISSGTGPFTITYTVDFNPTNNPLTCTLTVTGNNGYTQDYIVNIAPNTTCDPTFSQSSVNLPNTSGGGSFTINTGSGCYWSVSNSGCGFVNFSPSSGYGTTVVNYTYTANTNTTSRTCRISLQNNRSINLIQAGTQPPCTVPINLQSNPSQTSATVSWSNGTGTNYYKIRYKKVSDLNFLESALLPSNSTSYQMNGLTCNTAYDWYIYDSCSNGSILVIPSTLPASFTTTACATCTTTPSAPNSLTTGYPSSNTIGLSWAGSVVGFNNFDIERATSASGPFVHLAYVPLPNTNYNDNTGVAGTTYYYRVRACCNNNCSAFSNISSATACVWHNGATSVTVSDDTICLGSSVTLTKIGGNLGTGDVWTWYNITGVIGTGNQFTTIPVSSGNICVIPAGGCVNQPSINPICKYITVENCIVPCNALSNSNSSNITSNSATINWTKDFTITTNNQIIEYKPITSSTWSSNTLSNNAFTTVLNSLACSINYQYRVIVTCTDGLKDTVSGTFMTSTCSTNICDTLPKINFIPNTCNLYTGNYTGVTYQWQKDGQNVGTNSRFLTASGSSLYTVTISNGTQSCTSSDFIFNCTITGVKENTITDNYSIFPNPTKNSIFIQSKSNNNLKISISLTNLIGQEVQQKVITNTNQYEMSLKNLPVGVYILNISDEKGSGSMKIIKE